MGLFQHNTFIGQRVQLDGHQFIDNVFENCVLVYGGGPLVMQGNALSNVRWEFVEHAARTLALLASFYQQGGESHRFVELLLSTYGKPAQPPTPLPFTPTSAPNSPKH